LVLWYRQILNHLFTACMFIMAKKKTASIFIILSKKQCFCDCLSKMLMNCDLVTLVFVLFTDILLVKSFFNDYTRKKVNHFHAYFMLILFFYILMLYLLLFIRLRGVIYLRRKTVLTDTINIILLNISMTRSECYENV